MLTPDVSIVLEQRGKEAMSAIPYMKSNFTKFSTRSTTSVQKCWGSACVEGAEKCDVNDRMQREFKGTHRLYTIL